MVERPFGRAAGVKRVETKAYVFTDRQNDGIKIISCNVVDIFDVFDIYKNKNSKKRGWVETIV